MKMYIAKNKKGKKERKNNRYNQSVKNVSEW